MEMGRQYCFGDGKCIKRNINNQYYGGYYKPFKCPYNCKLVKCYSCKTTQMPKWILINNAGKCSECLKKRHNSIMMQKLFKNYSIDNI